MVETEEGLLFTICKRSLPFVSVETGEALIIMAYPFPRVNYLKIEKR
jgi:hypothetical protein